MRRRHHYKSFEEIRRLRYHRRQTLQKRKAAERRRRHERSVSRMMPVSNPRRRHRNPFGLPTWMVLGGAALAAWYFFFRKPGVAKVAPSRTQDAGPQPESLPTDSGYIPSLTNVDLSF